MSPHELAALVERAEAEAYLEMFAAAPLGLGLTARRFGAAVALLAPSLDVLLFNRVIGFGLTEPATEAALDDLAAAGQREGGRSFGFALSPRARPPVLRDWLDARGYRARDNWAKMARRAADVSGPATDLRIEPLGLQHAEAFANVAAVAFGMPDSVRPWNAAILGLPGWRFYGAFDGGELVATGALRPRGEVGWLGIGATLPAHRRRGAQSALMAARIRDAAALGCRWVATETGEERADRPSPSYRNMVRAGFALVYARANYQRAPQVRRK